MSTSRSRLTRSIQEIAKRDPDLRRAIEATKPRGDQPSSAGVGTSDAERDRVCCDGSVSDDTNPGTDTRDTSEGGQDASDGLNPDDPADISDMGAGSLAGLHDCDTGEPICFDGAGFIPPEGWDSPGDPPLDPSYEEETYWIVYNFNNNPSFGTAAATAGGAVAKQDAVITTSDFELGDRIDQDTYGICITFEGNTDCDNDWRVQRSSCNGSAADYCNPDLEDIIADAWPSDSCVNLAIKSGSIVGSKYDPENDGSYSKPMSEIKLCDDFGNSLYLSPAANGGWKTINATKDAGYLWGSNGQKIAHINGNEYSDPSI